LTPVLSLLSSIAPTFTKIETAQDDAKEFTKTINQFLFEEGNSIVQKIKKLPQSQIKDIKEENIISVVKAYYDQSGQTTTKEMYCAKVQFEMLLLLLQSPYLEKKLTALNEIKKLFDRRNRNKDVSQKQLADWLSK
jgi:hypothetical protein